MEFSRDKILPSLALGLIALSFYPIIRAAVTVAQADAPITEFNMLSLFPILWIILVILVLAGIFYFKKNN